MTAYTDTATGKTVEDDEKLINQCDGCRCGWKVVGGIHIPDNSEPWDGQAIACTADRYIEK